MDAEERASEQAATAEAMRQLVDMVRGEVAQNLVALERKVDELRAHLAKLSALSDELAPLARSYASKATVLKMRRPR